MKKLVIALVSVLLLVAACSQEQQNPSESQVASLGDTVEVNYVLSFENGTVYDTNIQSVAEQHGIQKQRFGPIQAQLGSNRTLPGFDQIIPGMEEGETKNATLQPSEAFGERNPTGVINLNKVKETPRIKTLKRNVQMPVVQFRQLPGSEQPVGSTVNYRDIAYEIVAKGDQAVNLSLNVEEGDSIQLPKTFWNSTVTEVREDNFTVRQDPVNNSIVETNMGPARIILGENTLTRRLAVEEGSTIRTQQGAGRVTSVNETKVVLDFNHPLAGKTINYKIELLDIVE